MSSNLNFNKVILGGRFTADPVAKTTQSGTPVANFTLAVNRKYSKDNGDKATDFIDCVAWRECASFIQRFFHKGSCICVEGSLQKRSWQTQNGETRWATEVVVDQVYFVDAKGDGFAPPDTPAPSLEDFDESELPFD